MTLEKGFFEAVMILRKRRYRGIVEITREGLDKDDVLEQWQALYTPPGGSDPWDMEMESWKRLGQKPSHLPQGSAGPTAAVVIWASEVV